MAQDIDEIRREISEMHQRLDEATYYELLGVKQGTPGETLKQEVTKAFRQMAKKWHVDRYSGYDLGEDKTKLQEIFAAINTAQQVLSNEEKRTAYDMELSGANTDVGSIIDAENAFRKGKTILNTGSYKGAHEQFRVAQELNPDDLEYRAHFLYTEYLLLPKNEEGTPLKRTRAQEIYEELNTISETLTEKDWLLTFLGVVSMGIGQSSRAESLFREALHHNRNNTTAQRQLRLIEMRREKKKGFFAQLMEKFKK